MTVKEQYNKTLADTLIQNLKKRQIEGFYCATIEEAKARRKRYPGCAPRQKRHSSD